MRVRLKRDGAMEWFVSFTKRRSDTFKFVVWVVPLVVVWGTAYPLIKLISGSVSPIIISWFRVGVAAVFFLLLGRGLSVGLKQFVNGVIYYVFFILLLNFGTSLSANPGLAAVMVYTQPIFVILLERFLGSTLSVRTLVGVLVGVGGILVSAASTSFDLGVVLTLLGGFVWGVGTVHYSHNLAGEDVLKFNAFTSLSTLPILLALTPLNYKFTPSLDVFLLLFLLSVSAQAVGYYLWFNAVRELGSVKASAGSLLTPVMAYALSYLILRDVPSTNEVVGSAITLIGVYIALSSRAPRANHNM